MMGGNFKTRLCVLFIKGRCHRQSCSFAHGDAELRRYNNISSSSFNGRPDYRSADLRDKISRQRSPPRRNSFERDARDRIPSHGHSPPRFGKKSDWGPRKRQHFDDESDFSGSLRSSDGAERRSRERKPLSSEFDDDQLKQADVEIDVLEDHKEQLQIYLEERAQEADSLNSKIRELEMQLSMEKEECKRISSKIRKFVKASNRHSRIQDELKRSEARLQRLGDLLGSDARSAAYEDDMSINMLSDEETMGGNIVISPKRYKASPGSYLMGPRKDQYEASPSKKRMRYHMVDPNEKSKQGELLMRSERYSRRDPHFSQTKNTDEIRQETNGRLSVNDYKSIKSKSNFNSNSSGDKYKDSKSTRMAANVDLNEKVEEGSSTPDDNNDTVLPPPPPVQDDYLQKKGKDEKLDVVDDDDDDGDGDDDNDNDNEDEMVDVDIV